MVPSRLFPLRSRVSACRGTTKVHDETSSSSCIRAFNYPAIPDDVRLISRLSRPPAPRSQSHSSSFFVAFAVLSVLPLSALYRRSLLVVPAVKYGIPYFANFSRASVQDDYLTKFLTFPLSTSASSFSSCRIVHIAWYPPVS